MLLSNPPPRKSTSHFLTLPSELFEQIICHLPPRDAIFLSLTCRSLYNGVLSAENHYLWYRVGRFATIYPGYKSEWGVFGIKDFVLPPPSSASIPADTHSELVESLGALNLQQRKKTIGHVKQIASTTSITAVDRNGERPHVRVPTIIFTNKLDADLISPRRSVKKQLLDVVKIYQPAVVEVDYKRMLVETMLGDTDMGCQWCLQDPNPRRAHEGWKIRLCGLCTRKNIIPISTCNSLGIDIDISHLPVHTVHHRRKEFHFLWKHSVQRLIAAKTTKSLDTLISERQTATKLLRDQAAKQNYEIRSRHMKVIYAAIKQKYTKIYEDYSKINFRDPPDSGCFFGGVVQKIPPEELKSEWFVEPGPGESLNFGRGASERQWRSSQKKYKHPDWKRHCNKDPLIQECLGFLKGHEEKWEDTNWVNEWAEKKLSLMKWLFSIENLPTQSLCGGSAWSADLPTRGMLLDVQILAIQWHFSRAKNKGVIEGLMPQIRGSLENLLCPECVYDRRTWVISGPNQLFTLVNLKLARYFNHLAVCHRDALFLGDTDWLFGEPSRWWFSKSTVTQESWLRKWWGDRWKDEYQHLLSEWRDNGGYFGGKTNYAAYYSD